MPNARILLIAAGVFLLCVCGAPYASASAWEASWLCDEREPDSLNDFLLAEDAQGSRPPWAERRKGGGDKIRKMEEKIRTMPPEQQDEARRKLERVRQEHEALRRELAELPPEKRKARMEEMKAQHESERAEKRAEFHRKFKEHWDGASESERADFCAGARERCADGGEKACDFVQKTCASY